MLVDSHCHLDFEDFGEDFDAVLDRAAEAGVGKMVTICTHVQKFDRILAVANRDDRIWCSVGTHPHNVENEPDVTTQQLVDLAQDEKVVAIGETGLDYFYEHSPRALQQQQFRAHIAAARETSLPLVVHTRDADDDTCQIMREEYEIGPFPGLIHCFSSTRQVSDMAIELGFSISLSGILTFKKAQELRDIVYDLPLESLLVETDSPYLAPIPKRGKRNEPSFVAHTAAYLAEMLGKSHEEIAEITTANFHRLFTRVPA